MYVVSHSLIIITPPIVQVLLQSGMEKIILNLYLNTKYNTYLKQIV